MINTILIDFGHTITQVNEKKREEVFKKFHMTEEQYKKRRGIYITYSTGGIKSDGEYLKHCSQFLGKKGMFSKDFLDEMQKTEIIDEGTIKTLRELKKRYRLIIVANNVRKWVIRKLKEYDIYDLFDGLVISSDIGVRKPDPRIFDHALKKFNLKPEECVFISDELNEDLSGAKVLGIKTVWFRNLRFEKSEEETFKPDFTIKKFEEIENVLKDLNRT